MALLKKILALLEQIAGSPLAQKVIQCLVTQSGWSNILACILAAPAVTPEEAIAKNGVVAAIQAHVAANPTA